MENKVLPNSNVIISKEEEDIKEEDVFFRSIPEESKKIIRKYIGKE